jgi:RimJ/RimL family protein N-acetyltransferase
VIGSDGERTQLPPSRHVAVGFAATLPKSRRRYLGGVERPISPGENRGLNVIRHTQIDVGDVTDRAELIEFLIAHEYPFHVERRPDRETVERWIEAGRYSGDENRPLWIETDDRRVGLVVLEDLVGNAPLFDLRLATEWRGRGLGHEVLRALSTYVFTSMPAVNRFEGHTREDNIAMRKTFVRSGFVKEAHYREAWPTDTGVDGVDCSACFAATGRLAERPPSSGTTNRLRG